VVADGMAGWQITVIAVGAALDHSQVQGPVLARCPDRDGDTAREIDAMLTAPPASAAP
jgi:hypothetical protein